MIYDGFAFRSRHDLPATRDFLLRYLRVDPMSFAPGALASALARAVNHYRPELDVKRSTPIVRLAGLSTAGASTSSTEDTSVSCRGVLHWESRGARVP